MNKKKRHHSDSKVLNVNKRILNEILSKNDLVLVDFWSPVCIPCRAMSTRVKRINENLPIKCVKVNTVKNYRLAVKHDVISLPTLILFKNKKEVKRMSGIKTYEHIKDEIEELMEDEEVDDE